MYAAIRTTVQAVTRAWTVRQATAAGAAAAAAAAASRCRRQRLGTTAAAARPSRPARPALSPSLAEPAEADSAEPAEPTSLNDAPSDLDLPRDTHDWAHSFYGLSAAPFAPEAAAVLLAPLAVDDVEIKPDGIIYLPEIKYRRILNAAFGPGGWGLAPRSETTVASNSVSREYALLCIGRLVSVARGEQAFFDPAGIPTASEGCKSNALMRCCKDLGIASELWDPRFIRAFKRDHCVEVFAEHLVTKRKRKLWRRTDDRLQYPYKE